VRVTSKTQAKKMSNVGKAAKQGLSQDRAFVTNIFVGFQPTPVLTGVPGKRIPLMRIARHATNHQTMNGRGDSGCGP
jgi:hypothetical protein